MAPSDVLADRYQIGEEIARGRAGRVLAARDALLERDVALKVLEFGEDLEITRALRAARAASLVSDERVIPVLDVDQVQGTAFVALPLLEARQLGDILRAQAPRPVWALAIADDVLRGLAALHAAGVVHREVSPENVLLLPDGSARLTSAGLTAAAADEALGLRVEESVSSAAHAMAHPDLLTDVAAVARMLRRLLDRAMEAPVEKVLDEAVSEDGESRYADAGELRRALVGAGLGRGGRRDLPPSGTTGALEAMPATSQLPAITVGTARPRGRRVVFALVAVAVVAAVAVTVLLRGDGDGANPADGEPAARPTASSASLGEVIPGIDAPSLPEAEGETPTLDEVLADAEGANLGLTGQNVIDRLQARQNLEGDERAAETADLFGTAAVAYASAAPWADLAEQVVAHLRPEVTVESLLALAGRDPSLLDPFFTRLVSGLEEMVALQGAERAQVAQELLPDLELAATEGTLTPALAAATAEVLDRAQEEAGEAPAEEAPAGPPPPEPPPPPPPG